MAAGFRTWSVTGDEVLSGSICLINVSPNLWWNCFISISPQSIFTWIGYLMLHCMCMYLYNKYYICIHMYIFTARKEDNMQSTSLLFRMCSFSVENQIETNFLNVFGRWFRTHFWMGASYLLPSLLIFSYWYLYWGWKEKIFLYISTTQNRMICR